MDNRTQYKGWVMEVVVISTKHVTEETMRDPDERLNQNVGCAMPCSALVSVWAPEDDEYYPEDVRPIAKWGREHGFDWFRLDSDGDVIAELPTYEW